MDLTHDLKVLVIDDHSITTQITKHFLERSFPGIDVLIGDDMNALDIMSAHPDISLIISDYDMPAMTGMDFFQNIRASRNPVPFVLSTGGHEERQKEIEADFDRSGGNAAFTTKPFTIEKLRAALDGLQPKPSAPGSMPTI